VLGDDWAKASDYFEYCSRKQGQALYEQIGVVDERDADELLGEVKKLREDVLAWLRAEHEGLLPSGY
jgi:hypothetical protein